jgi:hypothetical protein
MTSSPSIDKKSHGFNEKDSLVNRIREHYDLLAQPQIKAFLKFASKEVKRFAESFPMMRQAYATGAMAYGMISAAKPAFGRVTERGTNSSSQAF